MFAMIDSKGNEVVRYTYDSWGKVMSITGSMSETLGERNPFRYRGHFWTFVLSAVVGAGLNVATSMLAAKVTGQEYTFVDGIVAAASGAVSAKWAVWGGVVSGVYAGYVAKKNGGNIGEIVTNTIAAFVGTTCMGNLGSIIGGESLNIGIGAVYSATFGTGGNLAAAGVNAGISQRNEIGYDKTLHIYKKSAGRLIGYGASYNGKTGVRTRYKIYLSEAGFTYKVYI